MNIFAQDVLAERFVKEELANIHHLACPSPALTSGSEQDCLAQQTADQPTGSLPG
jgi:hypothetical protein